MLRTPGVAAQVLDKVDVGFVAGILVKPINQADQLP